MSKHTPGPWRSSPYQNNDDPTPTGCWEIHALTCKHVATTFSSDVPDAAAEANANLIAAAPEMLEALKDVLRRIADSDAWWIGAKEKGGLDAQMIVAAITKAEGRKP